MYRENFNHVKLYEDVKIYFDNNPNLKSADEIIKSEKFKINTLCSSGDIKKVYFDFYKWKEIQQSISNLFNQPQTDENVDGSLNLSVNNLPSITENKDSIMIGKPDKNHAIEALYNYVLHFLIIQLFEKLNGLENIRGVSYCKMCETSVNMIDSVCSACGEPHDHTIDQLFQQFLLKQNENILEANNAIGAGPEIEQEMEIVGATGGTIEIKKETAKGNSKTKKKTDLLKPKPLVKSGGKSEIDQETGNSEDLGTLENQNRVPREEAIFIPCDSMTNPGMWACHKCTLFNPKSKQKCEACDTEKHNSKKKPNILAPNADPAAPVLKLCHNCLKADASDEGVCAPCLSLKWNCPFKLCGKPNYGDKNGYCKHCGAKSPQQ